MFNFSSITGTLTRKHILIVLGIAVLACMVFNFASATEPTPQERAAAQLPEVIKEIDKTQEYADRNAAARKEREKILSCVNAGDCEGF